MLIDSDAALEKAVAAVTRRDPVLARLVESGVRPPLRKRAPGFAGLAGIVVAQQVSTASAAAIWARFAAAFDQPTPDAVLAASEAELRAPGLSGPKVRALRSIATAIVSGALPLETLHLLPADEAHADLVAVSGIGPWTADIYLMFCLGHPDAFAAGDLALQEAARDAYGLPARPDGKALWTMAEAWRPHRTAAAGILWAHYRILREGRGALRGAGFDPAPPA